MELTDKHLALLRWLADRCQRNFSTSSRSKSFLRTNGVEDVNVWSAYRIGVGDDELIGALDDTQRATLLDLGLTSCRGHNPLATSALVLPTFDPRQPDQSIGFVGISPAQNKHHFLTPPKGLACPADIDTHQRIILADAPLLMLRLAEAGAKGICLVEDNVVIPALADWLRTKTLVAASCKKHGLRILQEALTALGIEAEPALINGNLPHTLPASLKAVGLDLAAVTSVQLEAPITPALANEIIRYARERLAAGLGLDVLRDLEADDAGFLHAHGIGYLPPDFRDALSREAKRAFHGIHVGGAVLIPATDAEGVAVDAFAVFPGNIRNAPVSLLPEPQGLLLGRAARTSPQLVATLSLRIAARLWRSGQRNVVMFRDAQDAKRNAERLYADGVRAVTFIPTRDPKPIEAALTSAGIEVSIGQMPKPIASAVRELSSAGAEGPVETTFPDKPSLLGYDAKTELATFIAGDAQYAVEIALDSGTRLQVWLKRNGQTALDRFDLAVEAQRQRFSVSAAVRTGVPFELIQDHLIAVLEQAKRIQTERLNPIRTSAPKIVVSNEDRDEALAFLRRPDLLDAVATDLEALGWTGEEKTKRFLYLIATSRKLEKPLSATARAPSGSGKSHGLETIAALMPPEDVVHVSRLTKASLFYHSEDALRHKLLALDEADILTNEIAVSLRVLQSRGSLSQSFTGRDPVTGQSVTQFHETRGPVSVLTSTTMVLEEQMLSRCYQLTVDDSPEQTARIHAAQQSLRSDPAFTGPDGRKATVVRRHHALQRLLEIKPVLIPFAGRIEFPTASPKYRREHERFLNLIEASALLHQYQRVSAGGFIVADVADFRIALELAGDHIARAACELTRNAQEVLDLALGAKLSVFCMNDLTILRPDRSRHWFRTALAELLNLEIVLSPAGGRGTARCYQIDPNALSVLGTPKVRLRPENEEKLAQLAQGRATNLNPEMATG